MIRTRDRLIEVARQLFLIKGIENTTMLDIANASEHGRRTVYTYFKSKSDIYSAVIQQESEKYVEKLREVSQADIEPVEKLDRYLKCLFSVLTTRTSPTLVSLIGAWIKLDFQRAQNIRDAIAAKEAEFLCDILQQGVRAGRFNSEQADRMSRMLPSIILSLEKYAFAGHNVEEFFSSDFINFTMTALTTTNENQNHIINNQH